MQMSMKQARQRVGMTQKDLSRKTGIQVSNLSAIENGKYLPIDLGTYFKIEMALDAVGDICWEAAPEGASELVVRAIRRLCNQNYPIDAVAIFVARLFRQGHGALLCILAGHDKETVARSERIADDLSESFTPEQRDRIIEILTSRKRKQGADE